MSEVPESADLRSILLSTKVGALSISTRPTLEPANTIADAAAEMRSQSHGSAVICSDSKLVGIFTERDLMKYIAEGQALDTPLKNVMTTNPTTVTANDTLLEATRLMDEGGYRRLPVVDAAGTPVGIVDVKTITHLLVEHYSAGIYNQPSHQQSIAKNREGA